MANRLHRINTMKLFCDADRGGDCVGPRLPLHTQHNRSVARKVSFRCRRCLSTLSAYKRYAPMAGRKIPVSRLDSTEERIRLTLMAFTKRRGQNLYAHCPGHAFLETHKIKYILLLFFKWACVRPAACVMDAVTNRRTNHFGPFRMFSFFLQQSFSCIVYSTRLESGPVSSTTKQQQQQRPKSEERTKSK